MRGRLVALAIAVLTPATAFAQHFHHHLEASPDDDKRVSVCVKDYGTADFDERLPKVPWLVTTTSDLARQHFQQGMALYYGFNYEAALRSFKTATSIDPTFVMGWWGMALAAGPNINLKIDDKCLTMARKWSGDAATLADKLSPQTVEYQLAKALPIRYGSRVETDNYAKAMAEVWKMFENSADPNVGALYAESLMNKWPWDLWNHDGSPKHLPDTLDVLKVLRAVIAKDPAALGANHYLLHAVEAGPKPLESSCPGDFLSRVAGSSGHLQHMPSHSYFLMGDYAAAVEANTKAIAVDTAAYETACMGDYDTYSKAAKCTQLYYGHYGAHDYFFRGVAEAFRGRNNAALDDADRTANHAQHFINNEPGLQRYMTAPLMFAAAIGSWEAILATPEPPKECYLEKPPFTVSSGCHILRSMWYWARGMALVKLGSVQPARDEWLKFRDERGRIKTEGPTGWGNNSAEDVLAVAEQVLLARIYWAEGKQSAAIDNLKQAVKLEDALVYDEPPQFLFPTRQALGGAYLAMNDFTNARAVFALDLERHRENGRSLFGMWKALEQLPDPKSKAEAEAYRLRYLAAWANAAPAKDLSVERLWPVRLQ